MLMRLNMNATLLKILVIVIPYLIGLAISDHVFGEGSDNVNRDEHPIVIQATDNMRGDPFQGVKFAIHRNGEPEPCGKTLPSVSLSEAISVMTKDDQGLFSLGKYEIDHYLTAALAKVALPGQQRMGDPSEQVCGPEQPPESVKGRRRMMWGRGEDYKIDGVESPFLNFCDMGPDHTPILPDHDDLIPVESGTGTETLPCHFHTREGMRITSYQQLVDFVKKKKYSPQITNEAEAECTVTDDGTSSCTTDNETSPDESIHLFAVPAGRIFMFAPSYVGEVFEIDHVPASLNLPISLKVMSLSPKVFDVINFFDKDESKEIVKKAIAETSESHRMKRSSTGASGYNVNSQRTSENGFDTHGKTAMIIKRRCLKVLGFDDYNDSFTDGLQVLRYNKTTAYIPHMDWIDDPRKTQVHNYDSAGLGTNRHSTILLYMSDLGAGDGGETVFKHGWPIDVPVEGRKSREDALTELRASGDADFLKTGSWEETMVADCRSRLSVRPHSARAVLFYSQHPNGEEDQSSLHGGCPVLHGEKWAANLWVWNGPRGGFPGAPVNPNKAHEQEQNISDGKVEVVFINSGKNPEFKEAKLYFQDTYWGEFSHGDPPLSVNTFDGHEWNIRRISDDKLLKRIIIKADKYKQKIVV